MSGPTRLEVFRLALSYLERVEAEVDKWSRLRDAKKLDRTRYDAVKAHYESHLRKARRLVDAFRRDAQHKLPSVEEALREHRRSQKKLMEDAAAGRLDPHKANAKNRTLVPAIHTLEQQAAELRLIAEADSADALGGRVDLPLDDYDKQIGPPPQAPSPRKRLTPLQVNLLTGALMLALVVGTVYVLASLRAVVSAEFAAANVEGDPDLLRIECRNVGNRPILFYVPWPGGRHRAPAGAPGRSRSYGVLLFVQESGSDEYRLLEDAQGIWKYRGRVLEGGEPIEVQPRIAATVFLDLAELRARGLVVDAVAVEFARHGGSERERWEYAAGSP